jgi:hypothetical protein
MFLLFLSPKGQTRGLQRRALSHLCSPYSRPIARSLDSTTECRTPFRKVLQFIVIAVMSVISGTFPYTYGIFYVTIDSWRVRGPSRHRHGERHRRNALPKPLTRRRDGDDAHIRAYSRQGDAPLLRRLSYCFNLTRRTRRWEQLILFLCCSRAYNLCRVSQIG